ncbi:DUF6283 family protein [Mycobacteroides chelonae]|uniref:DUF6283 family protein n=1 Tax=Mycobacteroides chelonae TaxID=1774 RepID=UPI0009C043DB|nr:DUF6283 family protein [Mycobacteroides chelonae]
MTDSDTQVGGPAPRPCASCPYRLDVPSGIWAREQYTKLIAYDRPTWDQPPNLFLCHQTSADDDRARLCAGWVGCHGDELLALRLPQPSLTDADRASAQTYASAIPLFPNATAAAKHGLREIDNPSMQAQDLIDKIKQRRPDV